MPRLLLPVLILCLCGLAFGQDPAAIHQKIRAAANERNYAAAILELESLKTQNPEIFAANNYDYLLGRMAEKSGDFSAASANYFLVAKRNSVLKEYALWHLSKIGGESGNLLVERLYLQELTTLFPNSLLISAANDRLARNLFESRSYESAINALTSRTDAPGGAVNRANLALLADAYYRTGDFEKARELFTRLINETPNPAQPDDFALAGVKGLDLLDGGAENFGKSAPALSDWEHLRRAQVYQFNREFDDARLHFDSIIANHSASGLAPDAVYQIGRGYVQQGNFTEAIHWFERVLEQFPEHQVAADALLQAASTYARALKYRESILRYQRFISRYPDDERAARAHLNIVDVLRDSRSETEAQQWAAKVQEIYRGKQAEALALFSEARIYISRSDWQNALPALEKLSAFSDLGGTRVPGGTTATEVAFLRAYSLEQLGRYAEAIDAYFSIPEGRDSYYGALSTERLQLMAGQESTAAAIANSRHGLMSVAANDPEVQRQRVQTALRLAINADERKMLLRELKKLYEVLPAYRAVPSFNLIEFGRREIRRSQQARPAAADHRLIAEELLLLGLNDEAAPELDAHFRSVQIPPGQRTDIGYTIAYLYSSGDMANKASAFIERLWKVPDDFQPELIPLQVSAMLYPAPFSDSLLKFAPPRDVDPRFLLSIMRQESRFRPDVKSYAAARGLMQFISSTANTIAGELEREDFRQEELYDPSVSILFGSQYASNLFKLFPGQPAAVAASYNSGEDNMKRWQMRARSDSAERFVPEIAFGQTKDYVYRVMSNYRMYRLLYNNNLKATQ